MARLWEAETGQPIGQPMKHEGRVVGAVFDQAQKRILTWSEDLLGTNGTARLWDAKTCLPLGQPMKHEGRVFGAQFSGDGVRREFKSGMTRLDMAIRLNGKFKTAYPEGKPKAEASSEDEKKEDKEKPPRKEGEAGRRKITQYTRYGTVLLATFQSLGIAIALENQGVVVAPGIEGIKRLDCGRWILARTRKSARVGWEFVGLGEVPEQGGAVLVGERGIVRKQICGQLNRLSGLRLPVPSLHHETVRDHRECLTFAGDKPASVIGLGVLPQ